MKKSKTKKSKKAKKVPLSKHIKGRSSENIVKDKKRTSKKPGWRKSEAGKDYYESRPNRSDINPKRKI